MLSISEDYVTDNHKIIYLTMNNEKMAHIQMLKSENASMPELILEIKLIEITIQFILNPIYKSVEIYGVGVFSNMISFDELIQFHIPNEIINMPCVINKVQNIERPILLNFTKFCGKVANKIQNEILCDIDIKNPESVREFFEELLEIIINE